MMRPELSIKKISLGSPVLLRDVTRNRSQRRRRWQFEKALEVDRTNPNTHLLDAVVAITEAVPLGLLGLRAAREVGGSSAQRHRSGTLNPGNQLPPLPAAAFSIPHQTGLLP